ncbi:MAG: serine/threonine protein kinase [Blastocatellia bacterium]|nr:serine/threonine protein kinase [Blastocatellia bacterium]
MTPERYQQIKAAYEMAADCEAAERLQVLEQACGNDVELRRAVESLLADRNEAETFLETPAYRFANGRDEAKLQAGQRIGAYKLLQELGQGGMGSVWLAQRADEQYQKRVAIKLIKRGMDSDEILSRFRDERQILASLDHPNIARLLDGGTTPDGLPYFVMEHIEGQPIDKYCDTRKLTPIERLQLFRTACTAVQFAHQNLVVHRDLKPSNILVTDDGTVKLLDFGIAKILNPALFPNTVAPTAMHERPMTPAYASPEQVRGETISTASDVYSLGVVLYELLTGHRPYQITSAAPQEIERIVCGVEPEPPSRKSEVRNQKSEGKRMLAFLPTSSHRSLSISLRGDLDNIVLMALRKEPQRRYASVEQFSEDIRRYLTGLPILAREDTLSYRLSKFITRNKTAVAVAGLISVLLIGFLITTLVQSARIRRERDRAETERAKAEKVSSFLVDLFKVNDPSESRGNSITAREILDQGTEKIRAELKEQPETQAKLLDTVGQVYYSLGLYERAASLLEEALTLRRKIYGNEHAEVARTMTNLVQVIFELNQTERAETLTREALAIRRKIYGNEHAEVADSLNDLALLTKLKGDFAGAEPLYRETIAVQRKLLGNEHPDIANPLGNLAVLLADKKDFVAAEAAQREALAIRRKALGEDAPNVAISLHNLASILRRKGDYAGAEQVLRETLTLRRKLYPTAHPDLALTIYNLGTLMLDQKKYDEAETLLREALAMRVKVMPNDYQFFGRTQIELGRVLVRKNKLAEALPLLNEGLRIARKNNDKGYIPHALDGLGELYLAQKKYPEAELFLVEGHAAYQAIKDTPRAQDIQKKLIDLYIAWGKPEKAAQIQTP